MGNCNSLPGECPHLDAFRVDRGGRPAAGGEGLDDVPGRCQSRVDLENALTKRVGTTEGASWEGLAVCCGPAW